MFIKRLKSQFQGKLSTSKNLRIFADLYPKYIKGGKWLDKRKYEGFDTSSDTLDFLEKVIWPLHKLYVKMTPEEKKVAKKIEKVVDALGVKKINVR